MSGRVKGGLRPIAARSVLCCLQWRLLLLKENGLLVGQRKERTNAGTPGKVRRPAAVCTRWPVRGERSPDRGIVRVHQRELELEPAA